MTQFPGSLFQDENMFINDLIAKIREIDGPKKDSPENGALTGLVIGVINQKGGCGKTTTVINLGACLAEMGMKVLIIDVDPQGHATLGLGHKLQDSELSLYNILVRPELHISAIVRQTYHERLHIVPSASILASAQVDLINMVGREALLRSKINNIRYDYNFVILDCPPSLNLLTVNALVASCKVIIPVQTHYYSLNGMSELFKTIDIVRRRLNPELDIMGILPTLFDKRLKVNHQFLQALKDYFGNNNKVKIFDSIIHNCISLIESPIYGKPAIKYRPNSRGSNDYLNLTKEILALENMPSQSQQL